MQKLTILYAYLKSYSKIKILQKMNEKTDPFFRRFFWRQNFFSKWKNGDWGLTWDIDIGR